VPKQDLGVKRVCPETGKKFYDLGKDPIVSPFTGKEYPLSFFEEVVAQTPPKPKAKPKAKAKGKAKPAAKKASAGKAKAKQRSAGAGKVIVVPGRDRYHAAGCRFVQGKGDAEEVTKTTAKRRGYEPCSVCSPD
jgi:uncharacterized protein (TIGR02300 family)